jgi:hypothetical protein
VWTAFIWLKVVAVAEYSEHDESSGSRNGTELLDWLSGLSTEVSYEES